MLYSVCFYILAWDLSHQLFLCFYNGKPEVPHDLAQIVMARGSRTRCQENFFAWSVLTGLSLMVLQLSGKMWVVPHNALSQETICPSLPGTGNTNTKLMAHIFWVLTFVQVCQLKFTIGIHNSALSFYFWFLYVVTQNIVYMTVCSCRHMN